MVHRLSGSIIRSTLYTWRFGDPASHKSCIIRGQSFSPLAGLAQGRSGKTDATIQAIHLAGLDDRHARCDDISSGYKFYNCRNCTLRTIHIKLRHSLLGDRSTALWNAISARFSPPISHQYRQRTGRNWPVLQA